MSNKTDIINIYLDWVNNFLTVSRFAEYYEITEDQAEKLIKLGHSIHEGNCEFLKALNLKSLEY